MLFIALFCYAECHYAECHYAECQCAECRILLIVMLNVVVLSVVAPFNLISGFIKNFFFFLNVLMIACKIICHYVCRITALTLIN